MIDFQPVRKIGARLLQSWIIRREHIRVKTCLLDFSFPLITPEIVTRGKRQREKPQKNRHAPKPRSLLTQACATRVKRSCHQITNAGERTSSSKLNRHRLKPPVVKKIEGGEKSDLTRECKPKKEARPKRARRKAGCRHIGDRRCHVLTLSTFANLAASARRIALLVRRGIRCKPVR